MLASFRMLKLRCKQSLILESNAFYGDQFFRFDTSIFAYFIFVWPCHPLNGTLRMGDAPTPTSTRTFVECWIDHIVSALPVA